MPTEIYQEKKIKFSKHGQRGVGLMKWFSRDAKETSAIIGLFCHPALKLSSRTRNQMSVCQKQMIKSHGKYDGPVWSLYSTLKQKIWS